MILFSFFVSSICNEDIIKAKILQNIGGSDPCCTIEEWMHNNIFVNKLLECRNGILWAKNRWTFFCNTVMNS